MSDSPISTPNTESAPTPLTPALYLIPVTLGNTPIDQVLPAHNADIIRRIRHFVVEEIRTARRFLKQVDRNINIDDLTFYPMGKHADKATFSAYLKPLRNGEAARSVPRRIRFPPRFPYKEYCPRQIAPSSRSARLSA